MDQVFAVAHPTFIYLDHNNLTDLDSLLHLNMTSVETLQLSYNPFENVTNNSFNGKVNHLRFLYLDHCLIREFNAEHYEELSILATLDLSYNLIKEVTNQTITFGYYVEMDFVGNQITDFNVELPYNVKRVYLNKNLLTSLGQTLRFSQMSEVSMADNRIRTLGPEDFRGVHGVQMLDLQGNVIESVLRYTFTAIRKDIIYLDLSRNRIRALNGCVRYLSLLTSLNLTDNRIESFEEGEFAGLNELTELYLHGNRISTIGDELQRLDQLQYVVISSNRIRTLKREQFPGMLQYIYFAGNDLLTYRYSLLLTLAELQWSRTRGWCGFETTTDPSYLNKWAETILLERRQTKSVGRWDSRSTFLRSDWPRPFARREVGQKLFIFRYIAVGSLVVRASDSRPEGLGSMLDVTKYPPSAHGFTCRNCGGGDRGRVAISIVPSGSFTELKSHCHLYGAQGQRQAYLLPLPR
ncbi:relaxin receptor 2 [Trichonephila clavipes]|nr:relaxin receptor 2 [Trichonephila clavipes]